MTQEKTLSVTNDRPYAQTLLLIQELRSLRVSLASHATMSSTQRTSSELCLCFLTLFYSLLVLLSGTLSTIGVPRHVSDTHSVCKISL